MCICLPKQSSVQTHWAASLVESTHQWSREEDALYGSGNNHSSDSFSWNHAPIVLPHNKAKPIIHTVPKIAWRTAEKCVCVCLCKREREWEKKKPCQPSFIHYLQLLSYLPNTIWTSGIFVEFLILKGIYPFHSSIVLHLANWLHSSAIASGRNICRNIPFFFFF